MQLWGLHLPKRKIRHIQPGSSRSASHTISAARTRRHKRDSSSFEVGEPASDSSTPNKARRRNASRRAGTRFSDGAAQGTIEEVSGVELGGAKGGKDEREEEKDEETDEEEKKLEEVKNTRWIRPRRRLQRDGGSGLDGSDFIML